MFLVIQRDPAQTEPIGTRLRARHAVRLYLSRQAAAYRGCEVVILSAPIRSSARPCMRAVWAPTFADVRQVTPLDNDVERPPNFVLHESELQADCQILPKSRVAVAREMVVCNHE